MPSSVSGESLHAAFPQAITATAVRKIDAHKGKFFIKERISKMFEDKTLVCKECGKEFVFTAGEQEFYAERGFQNEP